MIRTHDAGSLRAENIGDRVTLAGWVARRRDHGGVAFIDLREASGVVQVVVREDVAHQLRVGVLPAGDGTVEKRPEGNENTGIPTGEIEVIADDVEILSAAAPLPFPIDEHVEVGEEVRLKHRYLDLRRAEPGRGDPAAQQGQPGRPRACSTRTTSSRSRRRRSPGRRPRAPATSWCRPG